MTQASLALLEALQADLQSRGPQPATCGVLSIVLTRLLNLFDQVEEDQVLLAKCVDDLAAHTGYQLGEPDEGDADA